MTATRYPGANWFGSLNESPGGLAEHLGVVLHIEQGTESWFRNPAAQGSTHFGIWETGMVDTSYRT